MGMSSRLRWRMEGGTLARLSLALAVPAGLALPCSPYGPARCYFTQCRDLLAAAVQQGGGTVSNREALAPLVQSAEQAAQLAAAAHRSRIAAPGASLCVPLFATSAVTGTSLQLLHSFLSSLQPAGGSEGMQGWCQPALRAPAGGAAAGQSSRKAAQFQIDSSFEVADVGTGKPGKVSGKCGAARVGSGWTAGGQDGHTQMCYNWPSLDYLPRLAPRLNTRSVQRHGGVRQHPAWRRAAAGATGGGVLPASSSQRHSSEQSGGACSGAGAARHAGGAAAGWLCSRCGGSSRRGGARSRGSCGWDARQWRSAAPACAAAAAAFAGRQRRLPARLDAAVLLWAR